MNEIRLDPLTGEWVTVAPNRSNRPVLPEKCPFCPGSSEIDPAKRIQIIPNRFPPFTRDGYTEGSACSMPAYGVSEIVVESLDHESDFSDFELEHAVEVVALALERMRELESDPHIKYVHFFRNRGRSGGVSITHPHSQIFAIPFVPPRLAKESERLAAHSCPLCTPEKLPGHAERLVYARGRALAYVPYAPRTPYEMLLHSVHVRSLWELGGGDLKDLVQALLVSLRLLDATLGADTTYTMTIHNSPKEAKDFHAHIEVIPVITDRRRVRFSRGFERSANSYLLDSLPEERARELRLNLERVGLGWEAP